MDTSLGIAERPLSARVSAPGAFLFGCVCARLLGALRALPGVVRRLLAPVIAVLGYAPRACPLNGVTAVRTGIGPARCYVAFSGCLSGSDLVLKRAAVFVYVGVPTELLAGVLRREQRATQRAGARLRGAMTGDSTCGPAKAFLTDCQTFTAVSAVIALALVWVVHGGPPGLLSLRGWGAV